MSKLVQFGKRVAKKVFKKVGYGIARYPESVSLEAALLRTAALNLDISTVIDVGASDGHWSDKARTAFPDAHYLLVEANSIHEQKLSKYKASRRNTDFVIAAAGDKEGEIFFDARDPFGGLASHVRTHENDIRIPVTTLDIQVKKKGLKAPFLVKLDTHGFEVPILNGAVETLRHANLVIIEVYNFKLTPDCLRFHEMCAFMEARGFRPVNICDPMFRMKDTAFWQADIFFLRNEHRVFSDNSYD